MDFENWVDEEGNPAGGTVTAEGIKIWWQSGPLGLTGTRDGASVEDVLEVALERLRFFQKSKFHCIHNVYAISGIEEALYGLQKRTLDRKRRGVEGRNEV